MRKKLGSSISDVGFQSGPIGVAATEAEGSTLGPGSSGTTEENGDEARDLAHLRLSLLSCHHHHLVAIDFVFPSFFFHRFLLRPVYAPLSLAAVEWTTCPNHHVPLKTKCSYFRTIHRWQHRVRNSHIRHRHSNRIISQSSCIDSQVPPVLPDRCAGQGTDRSLGAGTSEAMDRGLWPLSWSVAGLVQCCQPSPITHDLHHNPSRSECPVTTKQLAVPSPGLLPWPGRQLQHLLLALRLLGQQWHDSRRFRAS